MINNGEAAESNPLIVEPTPSTQSKTDFVKRFGSIYEHSPWIAERTWDRRLESAENTVLGLAAAMANVLSCASRQEQLALILAHPDLAGRAAVRGELTHDSTDEQSNAGLDHCSAEELQRFHELNGAYREKFQFPFIMAVRGSNRFKILSAFEERLNNSKTAEFDKALDEINKIARLRLRLLSEEAG